MKPRPSIPVLILSIVALAVPAAGSTPVLAVPERTLASFGEPIAVPVYFFDDGTEISSTLFSIDYDESCLDFDGGDLDGDGIPDDVVLNLPPQFSGSVDFDAADGDGEIDLTIADFAPPLTSLPDGVIATLILTPSCGTTTAAFATVSFSQDPAPSFGDTTGQSVQGTGLGGIVEISGPVFSDGFESGDLSAWQTVGN